MVTKKEIDDLDEAEELWNHFQGKASKIDFSDLGDGEVNLIAAALLREQQHRERTMSRRGPQRARREPGSGAAGTHYKQEAGVPQGGAPGRTPVQQQPRRQEKQPKDEQAAWAQKRSPSRKPKRQARYFIAAEALTGRSRSLETSCCGSTTMSSTLVSSSSNSSSSLA